MQQPASYTEPLVKLTFNCVRKTNLFQVEGEDRERGAKDRCRPEEESAVLRAARQPEGWKHFERSGKSSVLRIVMLKIKFYDNAKESLQPTTEGSFLCQRFTVPREPWYWPKVEVDDEDDAAEEEDEEEEVVELTVGIHFKLCVSKYLLIYPSSCYICVKTFLSIQYRFI